MSMISFPYPSISEDRKYTAAQWAAGNAVHETSGIVADDADAFECSKVTDSMNISVAAGEAIIAGHPCIMDEADTVAISNGDASYSRKDIVCLESNSNTGVRTGRLVVVEGTPAASPADPTLTQTATQYQYPLARVTVPAGATTLNSATLTDLREAMRGRHMHGAGDLEDDAVTEDAIEDGAVTLDKLGDDVPQILYGTSASPPAGTYPAGTIYVQYTA